jgi:hypothetical protein
LAPRLGFWVRYVFLFGFKLERGGSAGERFAEALTGFVAPVGVVLA